MGNQRVLLYFTLFFIVYMIWAQWQMDYGPQPVPVAETGQNQNSDINSPSVEAIPQAATTEQGGQSVSAAIKEVSNISERITIVTDVLEVEIDSKGGDIRRVLLRDYSVTAEKPEEKLVLLTDASVNYFVAQSGLVSVNEGTAPSHNTIYRFEQSVYRLAEGKDVTALVLQKF